MKYAVVLLALGCLVTTVHGQWSEPICVGDSTGYSYPDFQIAAGGGDTLWAFYRGSDDYVFCRWSMGDSWSPEETLATRTWLLHWLSSGVDRRERVWLSWYDGNYLSLGDTWAIWTRVHDSLGWGTAHLAFPIYTGYGQTFASDKDGNWHMGICRMNDAYPAPFSSAYYARFQGDTWAIGALAIGSPDPDGVGYGLPTFVARPDTGLWAVYSRRAYHEKDRVLIDHLVPFSSQVNFTVLYDLSWVAATGDSAGQMWIIYDDTMGGIWSLTYGTEGERDRRLVTADRRWGPVVCTDQMGWVWLFWAQSDTTLVASYNRGNGWSAPEVVTGTVGQPECIVSDQHGRIYASFYDLHGRYWTCFRISRPGIPELEARRVLCPRGPSPISSRAEGGHH